MRKYLTVLSFVLLLSCKVELNSQSFSPLFQEGTAKALPYVVECDTQRESVEIDPFYHIWNIKVRFSHRMDKKSVEANTGVYVLEGIEGGVDKLGEKVAVRDIRWDYDDTVMIYTVQLAWGKKYVLKISKSAMDIYGNHLDGRVGNGARRDDDFKDEPSDFYSSPFEVGGSEKISALGDGDVTPWGGITFSPFLEELTVKHFYTYTASPADGEFLSYDAIFGKGILLYPQSTSFYVKFHVPSSSKIDPESLSIHLYPYPDGEEISLLFYDESSKVWTSPDGLQPFTEIWVKPATYLAPSTVYVFEIRDAKDLLGIKFTDGKEDADDIYRVYISSSYDPLNPSIPPSPIPIPWCEEGYICFAVPDGGLFHYMDETTLPEDVKYGTLFFALPSGVSLMRTAIYKPDGMLILTDKIKDVRGRRLDTDGDGIEGGIFRSYLSVDEIPEIEMEDEPNDTFLQAFPLTGTCPSITTTLPAWDVDFYSYETGVTKSVDIFTQTDPVFHTNTAIRIYTKDGEIISYDLNSGKDLSICKDNCDAGLSLSLEPGLYYIEVYPEYPPIWSSLVKPQYTLTLCER